MTPLHYSAEPKAERDFCLRPNQPDLAPGVPADSDSCLGDPGQRLERMTDLLDELGGRPDAWTLRGALPAPAGMWDWDVASGQVTLSPEYFELYGLDAREYRPSYENWLSLIHPEDRAAVHRAVRQVLDERRTELRTEFRILHPQKGLRWIADHARIHYDARQRPLRIRGANQDITEHKQAELSLRERLERPR